MRGSGNRSGEKTNYTIECFTCKRLISPVQCSHPMNSIFFTKPYQAWVCAILFLLPVANSFAQNFQRIYGNSQDNYFTKVIPDGLGYYVLGVEAGNATVTRISKSGQHLWTRGLSVPSGFTDAVLMPNTGDLMFIGFTLPFNSSNKSILGVVSPQGVISSVVAYDTPGAEAFSRIVVNPGGTSFSVLGFHSAQAPTEDVVLLQVDANANITSKRRFPGTDSRFANALELVPLGGSNYDYLIAGAWSTTGALYQMSSAGVFVNGVSESDPYTFQDIARMLNGDVLTALNSSTNASPRLVRFDANLFPVWDVEVPGLDDISQVEEGGFGDFYALGTGTVNGISRAVLLKLNDNGSGIGQPVLLWKKFLSNQETSYIGGSFALLQLGNIAFADGRTGNPNGLGQNDAFLAVANANFTSSCTQEDTISLQPHSAVWNGPSSLNLQLYDPPVGSDLSMANIPRTAKGACGVLTPGPACSDIRLLVEPDQNGREVYYGGDVVAGDNIALEYDPPAGSFLPVGDTQVVCTATDTSGNEASCTFTVTVESMPYDSLQPPPPISPDGLFDRVRDRFGNPYRLADLQIPATQGGDCISSGYFDLYFEPGCGMDGSSPVETDRRNVLCQLFSDLSQFITRPAGSTDHVNIWVRNIANVQGATPNHLGLATSFYVLPATLSSSGPFKGGISDGEVWKTIISGVDSYQSVTSPLVTIGGGGLGFFHGMMAFNFANPNIPWHTDLQTSPAFNVFDLYSVALHEATHALGFASLMVPSGSSIFTLPTTAGNSPFANFFSRYDDFLWTGTNHPNYPNKKLITNAGACSSMYDYMFNPLLQPAVLQPNSLGAGACTQDLTNCPYAIRFVGQGVDQKVYTPNCWEGGSSLSHFEDGCAGLVWTPSLNNKYFVMSNANGPGQAYQKRALKPEERQVLCNLGYAVGATYGNALQMTNATYAGGPCPGIGVAGVNDGISPGGAFTYTLNTNSTLSGINILGNDIAASYECLEVVSGGGFASPANGSGTITYNSPGNPGVKLLRYIPVSSSGKKGNITYVFIRVKGGGCQPASVCNMVANGGFEMSANCCVLAPAGNGMVDCWEPYCGSPDVLTRNCTTSGGCQVGVSTYNSIPPTDTHNGAPANNNILGLYANNSSFLPSRFSEAIQTSLATPLIPGQMYKVSFWAKVNNNLNGPSSNIPAHIQFAAAASFPLAPIQPNAYSGTGTLTTLLPDFIVPSTNQWYNLTNTFTFTGSVPYSNLIVAYPATTIAQNIGAYVFLDDISVVPLGTAPSFTPPTPVCLTDPPVNLNSTVSIPGGVFTGPGVIPAYAFDPSIAGLGSHVITYTVTDPNGCTATATATIVVAQAPTVSFLPPLFVQCLNNPPINLNAYVNPTGGTFSGPGVSCSGPSCIFIPANAGVGTHTITYTYTGGACPVSVSSPIAVISCIDTCEITNNCLDFDGIDNYVNVPNPLNTPTLQNNFTVACWFRDDRTSGNASDLFRLFGFGWNGPRFEVGDQGGLLTFYNGSTGIKQSVHIRDSKWHYVAAVKNGSLVTIYLDGAPASGLVNLNAGTFAGAAQDFHIGDWAGGASNPRFWQGRIDEFKVWGAVLSQAQIQDAMYCSLDPNNSNLLVHFPFDQNIPWGNNQGNTIAHNTASGGLNGTLINFGLTAGNTSNWVGRERDLLPNCNPDHFAWLEGDNQGNYAGRSKVFDGDIFTAGLQIAPKPGYSTASYPVFTRRQPDGTVVWRTQLQIEGVVNDFTRTDEGCYLLVGYTPTFKSGTNNQSFIARVGPNGALQWLHTYEFGDRESLNRIIRSENPSNPLYRYAVCGIVHTTGVPLNTYDDVLLFTIDNQGNIGWMRKLGDTAGNYTDDEFHADLINFQGGYALTGAYRNTLFYQPVIFHSDNTGVQLAASSQYQQDIFFLDIEPSFDGNGLIVAGQVGNGDALLARVDATGNQVWAKIFPNLLAFRRIVVKPNGDIFAVGQRDGSAQYRNVVVKARDFGTTVSVFWQKHAELGTNGENNWKPADLAWYSGSMFFFTDTRFNNNNGWYNGDIGATLYDLDQTPDICPFTKDPLPVSQNFTLGYAQMSPISGILIAPPAPQISTPAKGLTLLRDSLCPSYGCECEFANMAFTKRFPPPVWQIPVSGCGLGPIALPGCPSQTSPIRFSGRLKCKGGCAFNGLSWVLTDPNGMQYSGASATAAFSINLTLAMLQVPAPGVYTIMLTGQCGTQTCTCKIQFTVPACPAPCDCTQPGFTNAVYNGFNWIQYHGCKFDLSPKSLSTCDAVQWLVAPAGTFNFVNFANTTGKNTASYTFPATGQYVICWNVTRKVPGGGTCTASRCWTLDVDCSLLLKPGDDTAENGSGRGSCDGSVVRNGGFTIGAEAGGLADIGAMWDWDYAAGNPEILLEAGQQDTNLVRLRGNSGYADLLYQDSMPISAGQRIQLSLAFRPILPLVLPGTELVVRISSQRQDSLLCNDDNTCHEILRLPIPALDSISWLLAGAYDSTTFVGKYLSIHVENPFIDDDTGLKSVVDIDNVCLRQFNFVSAKDIDNALLKVRIFPNPNPGQFTVELPQPAVPGLWFRITDLTGRQVLETTTQTGIARQIVHAGDLPGGLYFLQVVSAGRVLAVEKFVKQ